MRELERAGVCYRAIVFDEPDPSGVSDLGVRIARLLGYAPEQGFKTLVCAASSGGHVVCCVPSNERLDLKKAARAAQEKSLSPVSVRELEPVCGYVRGACSPVGMRRRFPVLIDETAQLFDTIYISGGRLGLTLEVAPGPLAEFLGATFADICQGDA